MTGEKNLFTSIKYDKFQRKKIVFGDNSKGEVIGLSKIALAHENSITKFFLLKLWGTTCCRFHNFVEWATIVSLLTRV